MAKRQQRRAAERRMKNVTDSPENYKPVGVLDPAEVASVNRLQAEVERSLLIYNALSLALDLEMRSIVNKRGFDSVADNFHIDTTHGVLLKQERTGLVSLDGSPLEEAAELVPVEAVVS